MPIPALPPEVFLSVVNQLEPRPAPLHRRAFAHAVDFCLVVGAASYFSTLFSVLVLSAHVGEIAVMGRGAEPTLLGAAALADAQLFAGSFVFSSVFFLVAVPLIGGKTLGMGLFGLRLRPEVDGALSPRPLLRRLAAYWINYLTGGLPSALCLSRGEGRLFQDHISGTSVVLDD